MTSKSVLQKLTTTKRRSSISIIWRGFFKVKLNFRYHLKYHYRLPNQPVPSCFTIEDHSKVFFSTPFLFFLFSLFLLLCKKLQFELFLLFRSVSSLPIHLVRIFDSNTNSFLSLFSSGRI